MEHDQEDVVNGPQGTLVVAQRRCVHPVVDVACTGTLENDRLVLQHASGAFEALCLQPSPECLNHQGDILLSSIVACGKAERHQEKVKE